MGLGFYAEKCEEIIVSEEVEKLVDLAIRLTPRQIAAQISASNPEYRAKHAEAMIKKFSDLEYRKKMEEAGRKRSLDPEWIAKNIKANKNKAKPIVCIETGVIYEGFNDALRKTNISTGSLYNVCIGKTKTAGGYHWRYATPEEAAKIKGE